MLSSRPDPPPPATYVTQTLPDTQGSADRAGFTGGAGLRRATPRPKPWPAGSTFARTPASPAAPCSKPPVHRAWSSDIPDTAMATEPALPACGDGRVVPADSRVQVSGPSALATEERPMPSSAHARFSGWPRPAPPVRRSCDWTLPAGFTLRSCIKEPKDSSSGKGIDHWLSQLRRRRPHCGPDPAELDKPTATRS